MINASQLREHVIRPVLTNGGVYSESAEELLMLTAATESRLGYYLHQVNGPAIGIFQMEPATFQDIHQNFLVYDADLRKWVKRWATKDVEEAWLMAGNMYYATAMARCHYLRVPKALPDASNIEGLAHYWKAHYNTHLGSGTVKKAIHHYHELAE